MKRSYIDYEEKDRTMAKVELHKWVKQIRGKMGDIVFEGAPSGKIIMTKLPDMSKVKWSKAQKAHRQRFKKAVAYTKAAMADPKVRKAYEKKAAKMKKRRFDLAVSDYFKGKDLLNRESRK